MKRYSKVFGSSFFIFQFWKLLKVQISHAYLYNFRMLMGSKVSTSSSIPPLSELEVAEKYNA